MSKIAGRKPLSTKAKPSMFSTEDIFGNPLALTPELKKELEEQGLVGRWVSAKELVANQGYHKRGWRAYERKKDATMSGAESIFGRDPSGVVRRGDCILAVKTKEEVETHRAHLSEKANRYKRYSREQAMELKQMARNAGIDSEIDEGYGEED